MQFGALYYSYCAVSWSPGSIRTGALLAVRYSGNSVPPRRQEGRSRKISRQPCTSTKCLQCHRCCCSHIRSAQKSLKTGRSSPPRSGQAHSRYKRRLLKPRKPRHRWRTRADGGKRETLDHRPLPFLVLFGVQNRKNPPLVQPAHKQGSPQASILRVFGCANARSRGSGHGNFLLQSTRPTPVSAPHAPPIPKRYLTCVLILQVLSLLLGSADGLVATATALQFSAPGLFCVLLTGLYTAVVGKTKAPLTKPALSLSKKAVCFTPGRFPGGVGMWGCAGECATHTAGAPEGRLGCGFLFSCCFS